MKGSQGTLKMPLVPLYMAFEIALPLKIPFMPRR